MILSTELYQRAPMQYTESGRVTAKLDVVKHCAIDYCKNFRFQNRNMSRPVFAS